MLMQWVLAGGGYVVPALDVHFELLHQTVQEAERNGNKLAVLLLSYGESPELVKCSTY